MLRYGGAGRHMAALDRAVATRWIKLDVTEEFIYNFSILLPKLAVLCIYKRVFSTKPYRYAIYILGAIVILNCAVGQVVSLTICRPFAYIWNKSISDGHCGNIAATYRYITIPNLLTDVGILVVPLHGVWHLPIKVVHKIALSLKFLIGCI